VVPADQTTRQRDPLRASQRRRGQVLEDALIEAAWAEVKEHGWLDFSMSRTAERAGASKKSLYARWPDKSSLIAATMRHAAVTKPEPIVPSGVLDGMD